MTPHLADTPVLTTERLTLRAPKMDDFGPMCAFMGSERARFIGGPVTEQRAQWNIFAHIVGMWALRGFGSFIVTRTGEDEALGMTGPWYPETWPEKEIGWTCWDPALEGTGMMHEAASAAVAHAFRDLCWTTAVSYIDAGNARSIRLAERLGASPDPEAATPPGDDKTLVYRHPAPERLQ